MVKSEGSEIMNVFEKLESVADKLVGTAIGMPKWVHPHSVKVEFDKDKSVRTRTIRFESKVVSVTISRLRPYSWHVAYRIAQPWGFTESSVSLHTAELLCALNIDDSAGIAGTEESKWWQTAYGSDVCVPGKFIRQGNWLNIPCPGTGVDGDPNLSIFLDEGDKKHFRNIIGV